MRVFDTDPAVWVHGQMSFTKTLSLVLLAASLLTPATWAEDAVTKCEAVSAEATPASRQWECHTNQDCYPFVCLNGYCVHPNLTPQSAQESAQVPASF